MDFYKEAVNHAKNRGIVLPKEYYAKNKQQFRNAAFSIAGVDKLNILAKVLDTLVKNIENGKTFNDWQKEVKENNLLNFSKSRLKTIYFTNIQQAFNAGRSENVYNNDVIESLQYSAVGDSRTRPTHKQWNGFVASKMDDFWKTHTPACGFNCRCSVIPLTKATGKKRREEWVSSREKQGLPVTPIEKPDDGWDYDKRVLDQTKIFDYLEPAKEEAKQRLEKAEKKLNIDIFAKLIINFLKKLFQ